jgi:hypothetical protein
MEVLADSIQKRCCTTCSRVLHGRSDKKFCNEQCRNTYNNQLNSLANNYMRSIDHQLRRNRRILQQVLGQKPAHITHLNSLCTLGFAFAYCTHTNTSRKGNLYRFCYEYGYFLLDNDQVRIVRGPGRNA